MRDATHRDSDATRLLQLRDSLQAVAESAGNEVQSAKNIADFLAKFQPDELRIGLGGGTGVAAVFNGAKEGPTVLVRSELDALKVAAADDDATVLEAAHLCGHDAHMTMVAGLAMEYSALPPECGRVVLLFQPAEETGEGAAQILGDKNFADLIPDYAIALHNLPGYPRGQVVCREGTFASASVGLKAHLTGAPSHAAEPELARMPTATLAALMTELPLLGTQSGPDVSFLTVTHARLGVECYGVSPGEGALCATLRSTSTGGLASLRTEVAALIDRECRRQEIDLRIEWLEEFPATVSHSELVWALQQTCEELGRDVHVAPKPFGWSEDFGHFSSVSKTLYFGLGIGESAPSLHQRDYEFPSDLLLGGVELFHRLSRRLLGLGSDS
jgi:amidohydrolase